ncbi:Receptor-like protein kinase THESEUS 1 [Senna tora]|uniref:Receptor-like protein kinase THESEUS 1 n=1 Tax=Senna tora TaxID=362788 RepID=A0A834WV80_9FABA|nr:Receptor-like protein kinase THESEUS 1 [Senna tora]
MLHQISQHRRLVAADLAGETAEVLRESEGEEAFVAAEEEVFGLERGIEEGDDVDATELVDWRYVGGIYGCNHRTLRLKSYYGMLRINNKSSTYKSDVLGRTTSNQVVINWCKGSALDRTDSVDGVDEVDCCSDVAIEVGIEEDDGGVSFGGEKQKETAAGVLRVFEFSSSMTWSLERQKLSPSKEDPWPPDRSLSAVVSLHHISRRRRLVAADLARENAEVLRESEGEEASAAAEEEVFGLEVSEGNLLLYSV